MSKITRGEEVERDPRRAMTAARKRRIWQAHAGKCAECQAPVPVDGPGVVYDHRIALWIAGSDADADIAPICKPCDRRKTPQDQRKIAKIKRIMRKHGGEKSPAKRPLKSRGFDYSKSRGFDGTVRPRKRKNRTEPNDDQQD